MQGKTTRVKIRVLSCDAKVIGSLVGGCRITMKHSINGEVLARGFHVGGSGDTASIMKRPRVRGENIYDTEGAAAYIAELPLTEPTPVEVIAEGPLAFPQAIQRASKTTWLFPGEDVSGDGLLLELHGFIVDIMTPESVDVFHSHDSVHLKSSVRLL